MVDYEEEDGIFVAVLLRRTHNDHARTTEFYGEIPTDGAFQNLSAQSFFSNGALCGAARLLVPPCKKSTSNLKYLIPGILSAILLLVSISIFIQRRKRKVEVAIETALLPQLLWRRVSHLELLRATNGFNKSNLLGTVGFGSVVYKGTISDGIDVAVKVLYKGTISEGAFKSFDSECEVLSNIRHRNLIKIIGCCSQIDFKALSLDDDMVAQVADFGIARLLDGGFTLIIKY
ncbi:hypothetical protein L3X38_035171 [Prunus dulcis]|uniref:Protein kinase domain-containing protein n=1 Tax=Prunus dulcis TaxID=3755 RepID=A0AAD4VKX1_PRUDU|nr:hypothetical protein L3X38_035171 [Prunus dulcis]